MRALPRRDLLRLGGAAALAGGLTACGGEEVAEAMPAEGPLTGPEDALRRLLEGNERFRTNKPLHLHQDRERRDEVAGSQEPFATILSCVDSRVPPEVVFDRGLGDLFVIRTAGHVVDDVVMGSIEFGAEELHIPLIVVMGHERCGAVKATLAAVSAEGSASTVDEAAATTTTEAVTTAHGNDGHAGDADHGESSVGEEHGGEAAHTEGLPSSIGVLVEHIRPSVQEALRAGGDPLDRSIRNNTFRVAEELMGSAVLRELVGKGRLQIVTAYYDLDSSRVDLIP